MDPIISVITPASRGISELEHIIRDFKNQIFKFFEHIIIWDGNVPEDVKNFMEIHKNYYNIIFTNIEKDSGNMMVAPGTRPRNHGISLSKGQFLCFCDDDDRYKDSFLSTHIMHMQGNMITIVQMSCQESRTYTNGRDDLIRLVPEIGHPFPACGHVGTPCFMVPRSWAVDDPWQDEPDHDYRFLKRLILKHNPTIQLIPGMLVDVDGLVIKGLRDWVSMPPFYRD